MHKDTISVLWAIFLKFVSTELQSFSFDLIAAPEMESRSVHNGYVSFHAKWLNYHYHILPKDTNFDLSLDLSFGMKCLDNIWLQIFMVSWCKDHQPQYPL